MNFIKKHAQAMESKGISQSTARIFSNPVGDYGSMVNERVGSGEWESSEELGNTWVSRNAFSYGTLEGSIIIPRLFAAGKP